MKHKWFVYKATDRRGEVEVFTILNQGISGTLPADEIDGLSPKKAVDRLKDIYPYVRLIFPEGGDPKIFCRRTFR